MKNNLSKNLKKLRKEEGLSQEQLADLLNVSRQSVSKWETEDAYPEMDKIILLCNKFDLDINDLLNGDIYEEKHKKEAIRDVYKFIDKTIKFFADSFSLFFKMTFKSKIKFILELIFLIVVLGIAFIIFGGLLREAIRHFIYYIFPSKVYIVIIKILSSIYSLISIVLSIAILMEIIKNRYLKYYKEKDILLKEEVEEDVKDKEIIKLKEKENKIIIRDQKDSNYNVLNLLYDIIIIFTKILFAFLLIPIVLFLIFLAFSFIGSFLVYKTGFFFIGLLLVILSSIVFTSFIILLIANFIFKRKTNFKVLIYSSLVNLIILGSGFGLVFVGSLSFNIIHDYDSEIFKTNEQIFDMNKNLKIGNHNIKGDIIYIEEDRKDVKIEYDYNNTLYSNYNSVNVRSFEAKDQHTIYINSDHNNTYEIFKSILKHLNKNKTINYSQDLYNFKIYASKTNLKIIKQNNEKND